MLSKSDIDHHFESPESTLQEARESLDALGKNLVELVARDKPFMFAETEPKTGNKIIKIRFPTPDQVARRKAYGTVSHARSALDQVIYAATVCFDGNAHGRQTYFPFAMDPNDFDNQFRVVTTVNGKKVVGRTKDATPRIAAVLKGFEPWWTGPGHAGGNDVLRFLGKISGPNKHRVALSSVPQLNETWHQKTTIKRLVFLTAIPERIGTTNDFRIAELSPGGDFEYYGAVSGYIGLSETHPGVKGDAVTTLRWMVEIAEKIVSAVKDVCVRELT